MNKKNFCKRVIRYCRLFKGDGGKNAIFRYKGHCPGEMALLIVQVHRKWSGLNAWPDESVIGHRSSDCREEGLLYCCYTLVGVEVDDMCFIMSSGVRHHLPTSSTTYSLAYKFRIAILPLPYILEFLISE